MQIRRASPDDVEQIADLHGVAIDAVAAAYYTAEERASWGADISPQQYLRPIHENEFFVSDENRLIVAFGELAPRRSEIAAVYVRPGFGRRGIGTAMLGHLERVARAYPNIRVLLVRASLNAVPFYEAGGFSQVTSELYQTRGGLSIRTVLLEKIVVVEAASSRNRIA